MDRRLKALVVATTLVVVLSVAGFIFVTGVLANDNSKTHVRTADDASDASVYYSYSFDGVVASFHSEDDARLRSGHKDNDLAVEVDTSDLVAAEGDSEWASDDASGGASGYDDAYEYYAEGDEYQDDQDQDEAYAQYDQDENDADGSISGDDASSVAQQDQQQQTQQQQLQQQTQQQQHQQQQVQQQQDQQQQAQQQQDQQQTQQQQSQHQGRLQLTKSLVHKPSKKIAATSTPLWPGQGFGCGVDRNVLKNCTKPTTPTEVALYRAARATARLEYFNYECSGVLLGNSPTNIYLLATGECAYNDHVARTGYVTFTECKTAKQYSYPRPHSLYHANRTLGYVIIKINSTHAGEIESIANYAKLSRGGAVVGSVVIVPSDSFAYGLSIATTYELKPITIQPYIRPQKPSRCNKINSTTGLVTFMAHSMDERSRGSPVFSVTDGSVVALLLCGGCDTNSANTALSSKSIIEDLEAHGLLRAEFVSP